MEKFTKYPKVYQPLQIGNVKIKNRIMIPPMLPCLANTDGSVTAELIAYCRNLAKSGAGLIYMGETPVDNDRAFDHPCALNLGTDLNVPRLSALVDEMHRYGAKVGIELNHAGANAGVQQLNGKPAYSPSPMPSYTFEAFKNNPIEVMDRAAMDEVKQNYLLAAARAVTAGFDVITIHCAHGWLLGQFLSPTFNTRTDEYGGCIENRMRFPLEIIQAVHDAFGSRAAIDIRVSGSSRVPDALVPGEENFEDLCVFLKAAEPYVDMINVSASFAPVFQSSEYMIPSYFLPHMTNVEYAEKIKNIVHVPVAIAGSITTLDEAEELIEKDSVDIVGMGRANLADNMLSEKGRIGREEDIRPCLRCTKCAGGIQPPRFSGVHCAVNPVIGRELQYGKITPALQKKKVVIIGGGVAGMEAAQICTQVGHEVVLYEASDCLGGMLHIAGAHAFKEDMQRYTSWMIHQTEKCGAVIHLNTKADADIIKEENPEVILIAAGAKPFVPRIPTAANNPLISLKDVAEKKAALGQNVVIAGAGLSGIENAISLAQEGKQVTVIDMISPQQFLNGNPGLASLSIMRLIQEMHIQIIFNAKLKSTTSEGIEYEDAEGSLHSVACDSVINALGMKADAKDIEPFMDIVPETYLLGDCEGKAMSIEKAVLDAFTVSMDL